MAVVPTFIIAGETAGRRYEQDNWRVDLLISCDWTKSSYTACTGKGQIRIKWRLFTADLRLDGRT